MNTATFRKSPLFRFIALTVLAAFVGLLPAQPSWAQVAIVMPPPGQMIHVTHHFEPPQMVGLKVDLKDPFSFDFIMDQGETPCLVMSRKKNLIRLLNTSWCPWPCLIRTCGSTFLLMNPNASSPKFSRKQKWAAIF